MAQKIDLRLIYLHFTFIWLYGLYVIIVNVYKQLLNVVTLILIDGNNEYIHILYILSYIWCIHAI